MNAAHAQNWVVAQPTHDDATTMGVVMAPQFAPRILLLPWTGFAANKYDF